MKAMTRVLALTLLSSTGPLAAQPSHNACAVTTSAGATWGAEFMKYAYGSEALSVVLFPNGITAIGTRGPGSMLPDGALVMKYPWHRGRRGALSISGRRVDGEAAPLRSRIPYGYGEHGFQSTELIFPAPGCWEVTGSVGGATLTFTTLVLPPPGR